MPVLKLTRKANLNPCKGGWLFQQDEFRFGILATPDDDLLFELMAGNTLNFKRWIENMPDDFVRPVCVSAFDNTFPSNE